MQTTTFCMHSLQFHLRFVRCHNKDIHSFIHSFIHTPPPQRHSACAMKLCIHSCNMSVPISLIFRPLNVVARFVFCCCAFCHKTSNLTDAWEDSTSQKYIEGMARKIDLNILPIFILISTEVKTSPSFRNGAKYRKSNCGREPAIGLCPLQI